MILLDSNIVIYLRDPIFGEKIVNKPDGLRLHTCNTVIAEVLGYKSIDPEDAKYFKGLFANMKNHVFDEEVTNKVIEIRKTTNIQLTDAIIAATALVNDLELWTHNVSDFKSVAKLRLFDPILS